MTITGVSNRRFAELDGCTEGRVRTGRKRGELPTLADGTLDPKLAGTSWRARNATAVAPNSEAPRTLAAEQRKREIALGRLRQQELMRRTAKFVTSAEAASLWRQVVEHVGTLVGALPMPMSERVAACSTAGAMQVAIRDVVYHALTMLAETDVVSTGPEPAELQAIPDDASKLVAETAKVGALARLRQLDVDVGAGAVVSLATLEQMLGDALFALRARMLSWESALPPVLVATPQADQLRVIRSTVGAALAELPGEPEMLLRLPPAAARTLPSADVAPALMVASTKAQQRTKAAR